MSFLGYGAVKYLGATRGVLLAALAGGLVSSTAVTLTNARRAAVKEGAPRLQAAGVAAATAVSFLRVIAIVAALNPLLLVWVGPALATATLIAVVLAAALIYWRVAAGNGADAAPVDFRNPFSFWPVVGFALFLGVVIVLGRLIGEQFGSNGALLGALGLGLADVDAVTIAVTRLAPEPLTGLAASLAILAAVVSNMTAKLVISVAIGRGRFAAAVTVMTVACWAAGGAALWLTLAMRGG